MNGCLLLNERGIYMQVLKDDIKKNILKQTSILIVEKGINNFTMREIASKSGITVGNLYRYFENKDMIIKETIQPVVLQLNLMLKEVTNNQDIELNKDINVNTIQYNLELLVDKLVDIYIDNRLLMKVLANDEIFYSQIVNWLKQIMMIVINGKYDSRYVDTLSNVLAVNIVSGIAMIFNEDHDNNYNANDLKELMMNFLKIVMGE
jgi:AcrR family transcriptional regulator